MEYLNTIGANAKKAQLLFNSLSTDDKNEILLLSAEKLIEKSHCIIGENKKDVEAAAAQGVKGAFIDRLTLTEKRILDMAEGLKQIAALDDPVGEVLSMKTLKNGLMVGQKRVAIGVIGIIYEARPNVTADAFGLCFKAGSSVILRGGKEALNSNKAITDVFQQVLNEKNLSPYFVQLLTDTSRETASQFMKLNGYIDVLIPRGGAGLIKAVVENSTVPVIETGTGNCHIYVDDSANFEMALDIVINAKTQRPGVCNAAEKLLIHESIYKDFLPAVCAQLIKHGVEIRGDEKVVSEIKEAVAATEEDWGKEYADYIIGIKIVESPDDAIGHIQKYSTGHSEAIVTESYANSQKFLNYVDSAAVYVNASTRFTDGFEFGFGAEIGISTQKLHARGPMGLKELTTTKYIIYGNGQIRK